MPFLYHKGAKKAYQKGRAPVYSDTESGAAQKELERMLREQIRRKTGYAPKRRKRFPEKWLRWIAKNTGKLNAKS